MINWRYHIMSIIAIFLALGLGITIGISLGEDGTIDVGQEGLVEDIRHDIDEVQNENNALSADRSTNLLYQDNTFPYLVSGQLQDKGIALISAAAVDEGVRRSVASSIETAGGQVVSTTIMKSGFDAPTVIARAAETLGAYPALSAIDESTLAPVLGAELAAEIATAAPPLALEALQGALVDSIGGNYELPVDAVLILTDADDSYSPLYSELEREIILNLNGSGIPVVGGEPTLASRSEVPMFIATGIASADNIESRIGQLSLIYALAGERDTYGVKPTSDLLIPILRIPAPAEEDGV